MEHMERQARIALAALLVFGSAGALAQEGDLSGVTMRVLDDLGDAAAVVLELDGNRGESEQSADGGDRGAQARDEDRSSTAATPRSEPGEERRDLRRERDDLHDAGDDERSEGRLEDRDVERPAAVQPPAL
jgi:hypothetical protein